MQEFGGTKTPIKLLNNKSIFKENWYGDFVTVSSTCNQPGSYEWFTVLHKSIEAWA